MVSKIVIVSLTLFVSITSAAVAYGRAPPKPKEFADKEGCYVEEINDVIPFGGEAKPLGFCEVITCENNFIYYASCGVVGTDDPKCFVTDIDKSKTYPECCPTIKCESENDIA